MVPACMCLVVLVVWSHMMSTWPPSRSVMAGPVPLYGTVTKDVSIAVMNSMPHRCEAAPIPALATGHLVGVGLGIVDQALQVGRFEVLARHEGHRHFGDQADIFEGVQRIVGQLAIERCTGCHADVMEQHRVTIRYRICHQCRYQRTASV